MQLRLDTTNCITIFESDAGTAFNLAVGVELDLAGEEKPANGTYTHAYVIMANTFGITHSQRFGGAPLLWEAWLEDSERFVSLLPMM